MRAQTTRPVKQKATDLELVHLILSLQMTTTTAKSKGRVAPVKTSAKGNAKNTPKSNKIGKKAAKGNARNTPPVKTGSGEGFDTLPFPEIGQGPFESDACQYDNCKVHRACKKGVNCRQLTHFHKSAPLQGRAKRMAELAAKQAAAQGKSAKVKNLCRQVRCKLEAVDCPDLSCHTHKIKECREHSPTPEDLIADALEELKHGEGPERLDGTGSDFKSQQEDMEAELKELARYVPAGQVAIVKEALEELKQVEHASHQSAAAQVTNDIIFKAQPTRKELQKTVNDNAPTLAEEENRLGYPPSDSGSLVTDSGSESDSGRPEYSLSGLDESDFESEPDRPELGRGVSDAPVAPHLSPSLSLSNLPSAPSASYPGWSLQIPAPLPPPLKKPHTPLPTPKPPTREVVIFTNPHDDGDVPRPTFGVRVKSWLATHTPLASKKEYVMRNEEGSGLLPEFAIADPQYMEGLLWFWQSEDKTTSSAFSYVIDFVNNRYKCAKKCLVYSDLVDEVMNNPKLFSMRQLEDETDVVGKITVMRVDSLMSSSKKFGESSEYSKSILNDTRTHILNQVLVRGLHQRMAASAAGKDTVTRIPFRLGERLNPLSPRAPRLKLAPPKPLVQLGFGTTKSS